jgi:ribosome assembly protein YihI (activator of Der GTPase)
MAHGREHLDALLKLPAQERSAAAEALLESLEQDEPEADVEQAWAGEIQDRIARDEPGISADAVFAEGRARLKGER